MKLYAVMCIINSKKCDTNKYIMCQVENKHPEKEVKKEQSLLVNHATVENGLLLVCCNI